LLTSPAGECILVVVAVIDGRAGPGRTEFGLCETPSDLHVEVVSDLPGDRPAVTPGDAGLTSLEFPMTAVATTMRRALLADQTSSPRARQAPRQPAGSI